MRTFSVKNFEKFQHYKDRSPPWIKLYNELLDDYAFGRLHDANKFHLIAIWLLASRSGNKIPFDPEWISRRINANTPVNLNDLVEAGFIIINQELQTVEQVASKTLAECSDKREPETERESESETEGKKDSCVASGPTVEESFERFRSAYPKREGSDPKKPAFEKFRSAVNGGVDPNAIISAAKNFADECTRKRTEPRYIPMAKAWLHQARWEAYTEAAEAKHQAAASFDQMVKVFEGTPQWKAWAQYWRATHGVTLTEMDIQDDTGRHRPGRHLKSEWPPGHDPTPASQKQAA